MTALAEGEQHTTRSIGIVGTYPPTRCGIATFTRSLIEAITERRSRVDFGVVSCVAAPGVTEHPIEVVAELVEGSPDSVEGAAAALNDFDATVVQHEYGIYGGEDGSDVLALIAQLSTPVITVLHTVLERPTDGQRSVLEDLVEVSDEVVVQSSSAKRVLLAGYEVDPRRTRVIPHGAVANLSAQRLARSPHERPRLLTWGLISEGKGIEVALEAVATLRDLDPAPLYSVVGATHPRVLASDGDKYRTRLEQIVRDLRIEHMVEFDSAYHSSAWIRRRIRAADIVLLPYRSREQVVSGTLTEAIAAGRPVVATAFPHARELLAEGSGIVVPHDDVAAMAAGLRSLLTDPALARRTEAAARRQAPALSWSSAADGYLQLLDAVTSRRLQARL